MNAPLIETTFFVILIAIALFMLGLIVKPFLSAIIIAITLGVIFKPMYRKLLKLLKNETASALLTLVLVTVIVFIPLTFFTIKIFSDATSLYATLGTENTFDLSALINNFIQTNFSGLHLPLVTLNYNDSARQIMTWLVQNLSEISSNLGAGLFTMFLSLLGLFYILKDGKRLTDLTSDLIPLAPKYKKEIVLELKSVMTSVIKGTLAVAVLQGIGAVAGFSIFNLPDPVFWGSLVAVASPIPLIGPALVIIPAVAYLFLAGQLNMAIGLTIWSIVVVNFIYNVVSPQLMHKGNDIHPFIILLGILGGMSLFGPIGFILGPLVIAFLVSLINIYPKLIIRQEY